MCREVKIIAFDADDTLWPNQKFYQEMESECAILLTPYASEDEFGKKLLECEHKNISLYGYGAKAFTLSIIETAISISKASAPCSLINEIIALGKNLIDIPIEPFEGVEETLSLLKKKFHLALATKGDPIDQLRKLEKSGLSSYFSHAQVMPTKSERDYEKLFRDLCVSPSSFVMVGDSIKSDILPPLQLGANAIHIPHKHAWEYEVAAIPLQHPHLTRLEHFSQLQYLI